MANVERMAERIVVERIAHVGHSVERSIERPGTPIFEHRAGGPSPLSARALTFAVRVFVAVVWISAALFGLYIIAFFARAVVVGTPDVWNQSLPNLFDPARPLATIGIGLHFLMGAILLMLGPLQLMASVRDRAPAFHRWTGRVYATAAFLTGAGGLVYIASQGTIGGPVMSTGFALGGALLVVASVETVRHAMARRLVQHRAWAIRLFALAIGSWLYRVEYGFWALLTGGIGHAKDFSGAFDYVMDFGFYVPNLIVAEMFIRSGRREAAPALRWLSAGVLLAATTLLVIATYRFTVKHWGPPIIAMVWGE